MKKGINIWSFPAGTLEESFALAKDAGFEGVEVGLLAEGEVSLLSTEKDLLKVKKSAEDNGIELYSVATGLYWDHWLTSDCEKEREKAKDIVKKHLEVAEILGCETILGRAVASHCRTCRTGRTGRTGLTGRTGRKK